MASNIIEQENLAEIGDFINKIETSKQQSTLAQIEAINKDNERQYDYALKKLVSSDKKWWNSFYFASVICAILIIFSLYLISNDKDNIGLGILSSTLTALFGFLAGIGVAKSNI